MHAQCLAHGKCLKTRNYDYLCNSKELGLGEVNQLNSVGKVFDKWGSNYVWLCNKTCVGNSFCLSLSEAPGVVVGEAHTAREKRTSKGGGWLGNWFCDQLYGRVCCTH